MSTANEIFIQKNCKEKCDNYKICKMDNAQLHICATMAIWVKLHYKIVK